MISTDIPFLPYLQLFHVNLCVLFVPKHKDITTIKTIVLIKFPCLFLESWAGGTASAVVTKLPSSLHFSLSHDHNVIANITQILKSEWERIRIKNKSTSSSDKIYFEFWFCKLHAPWLYNRYKFCRRSSEKSLALREINEREKIRLTIGPTGPIAPGLPAAPFSPCDAKK